ncbi:MAG: ABC transporter permease [Proteobacteria bacterium]|nr:ABC transporter permease [Pseudomonadota bacterium]MDA1131737.1 ABC transporter permease [Pseudomonadota bacterium]
MSDRRSVWSRLAASPSFLVGASLSGVVVAAALVSLAWTPIAADHVELGQRLLGPGSGHWFGTDHFGRDVAARLLVGAGNALVVGVVALLIGLSAGVATGLVAAAAAGSWLDEALMRAADFAFAFPAVLTAILFTVALGPGIATSIVAIGIFNIPVFARTARASGGAVWSREYVLSAQAIGKGRFRITTDHVLPNITAILLVQATASFAVAILAEAGLAYLGLSTQPPEASWGRMLFEARTFLADAPHLAVFPGLAIAIAVLGVNLLGDGLRDAFDPRGGAIF